jgi:hypothetical protein
MSSWGLCSDSRVIFRNPGIWRCCAE